MIAVLALETYVECVGPYAPNATHKATVEAAILRHYSHMRDQVKAKMPPLQLDTWGTARYQEVLLGVQWLVDRGHTDDFLFELMELVRGVGATVMDWERWFTSGDPFADRTTDTQRCWPNKTDPTASAFMIHHGVNIMEAIKTGPAYWRVSGNQTDADSAATALTWIDAHAYSADGTMTAPDCLNSVVAGHDPMTGIETCSVVESMFSLRTAYEITGDVALYDRLERIAYNSLPDTTDELFGGNCYYHSVNQFQMSGKYGFEINGCCTGNVHQGWPKFIIGQTQTRHGSGGTGIVISGYAPHTATFVDGTSVSVGGQYPYADNVTVSVKRAAAGSAWSLSFRIPCWAESATVIVGGASSYTATPCSLFPVPGLAASATELSVTVAFASSIKVVRGKWRNGAAEVHRGPLVYAYPVPGVITRSIMNSTSWSMVTKVSVSPDASGGAAKPTMIALRPNATEMVFGGFTAVAGVPFARAHPPATIKVRACAIITDPSGGKGRIPGSPVPTTKCIGGGVVDVELVPLSHTYIRLTALPVLDDSPPSTSPPTPPTYGGVAVNHTLSYLPFSWDKIPRYTFCSNSSADEKPNPGLFNDDALHYIAKQDIMLYGTAEHRSPGQLAYVEKRCV